MAALSELSGEDLKVSACSVLECRLLFVPSFCAKICTSSHKKTKTRKHIYTYMHTYIAGIRKCILVFVSREIGEHALDLSYIIHVPFPTKVLMKRSSAPVALSGLFQVDNKLVVVVFFLLQSQCNKYSSNYYYYYYCYYYYN